MGMDKTIRRVTDLAAQRVENFRYWQSLPPGERLAAVWETTQNAYAFSKEAQIQSEPRPRRTLVRLQRA
jgi:hypothetical protein